MKIRVQSSDLLKKLQVVSGAIASNPVLPILENFLFDVESNILTISATDLETSLVTTIEVDADIDGKVAIQAKKLVDTLKGLPSQPIEIVINDNLAVTIKSSNGKYKLSGENGYDFPIIPSVDEENSITVDGGIITESINNTIFATSTDELRPAMTGVFFNINKDTLTAVATDAHKLVELKTYGLECDIEDSSFIVPKKALGMIKGVINHSDAVRLSFNDSNAFFEFNNIKMACRLIDSKFPEYSAVIPKDNDKVITVSRLDLLACLKRVNVYANKTTNQVVLSIENDILTVSAQDIDFSNEASEQIPCSYDSAPIEIGFNGKYLIEMLNTISCNELRIELNQPNRAGIFKPKEQADNEELLMLAMPIMLG